MMYSLAVALGGALGAVSRYWLIAAVSNASNHRFPWGTLVVNVLGSLVIGVMYVLISERMVLSEQWRAVLIVGYLGAFTTFSTFSLDALLLLQEGFVLQALTYIVSSVVICLLCAWLGIVLMRVL
jgi:CrcB protein